MVTEGTTGGLTLFDAHLLNYDSLAIVVSEQIPAAFAQS
jgi:hypothetical protein